MMAMASLLTTCVLAVVLLSLQAAAQLGDVAAPESNSTTSEPTVNVTKTSQELPPAGLPEIVVDPVDVVSTAPVALPLPDDNPQTGAKQMEDGGVVQVIDPDRISIKVVGSNCTDSSDCLIINNSNCINGRCDCISGFIQSKHSLEKCIKVPSGLDDSCEEDVQCSYVVVASECRGGVCSCPPNYVFEQAHCWERQLLGGTCNTSAQCDNVAMSLCAQGVCACQPPLIPNPSSDKCLQVAGRDYRASCEEDIQCTSSYGDEAHCSNSQCVCSSNYHYNSSVCVPDKKLGEECLSDEDCTVSDVIHVEGSRACIDQVCGCAEGFTSLPGEEVCMEKSSGEELAVSFIWLACIVVAKYYLP
ncbi:cell death abnormality protein 1-like [Macrosteles quadrilineatus]|uniref:cell death abnormality protein 1-like n=1 Tax=Macrosteles quadrilineatus TaxID=74068 RepID=UPI0023E27A34|nr:cell death abnormality protein 1-like [Macrosteles quadrilineatus]